MLALVRFFVALLFLFVPVVISQSTTRTYYKTRAVTGTLNRITVAQSATTATRQTLKLDGVFFACSVLCTPAITEGGTVTGGTVVSAPASLDKRGAASTAVVTEDATVTGGTTVFSHPIQANGERSHNGGLYFPITTTQQKFTVELISGSSGVLYIWLQYSSPVQ